MPQLGLNDRTGTLIAFGRLAEVGIRFLLFIGRFSNRDTSGVGVALPPNGLRLYSGTLGAPLGRTFRAGLSGNLFTVRNYLA